MDEAIMPGSPEMNASFIAGLLLKNTDWFDGESPVRNRCSAYFGASLLIGSRVEWFSFKSSSVEFAQWASFTMRSRLRP
jgi:hypothetical protein